METCKICGHAIEQYFGKDLNQELLDKEICFTCKHWEDTLAEHTPENNHKWVVANGSHFFIGPEDSKDPWRGFDGAHVMVHFFDGTVVDTTNLWCQGDIPDGYWRNLMPDNAKLEWCR